jgi:uncharacterized protein YceK
MTLQRLGQPAARWLALALAAFALAGCGTIKNQQTLLESTLETYASVIRWGNFDEALSFVDPATLKAHPVTPLDLQRYQQVRVSGYNEQPARHTGEDDVRQTVEITIVNINTQAVRSIIDTQTWHWDAAAKRWWLTSGLPNITASN